MSRDAWALIIFFSVATIFIGGLLSYAIYDDVQYEKKKENKVTSSCIIDTSWELKTRANDMSLYWIY